MEDNEINSKKYKIDNSDNLEKGKKTSDVCESENLTDEKESAYLTPPSKKEQPVKKIKREREGPKDTMFEIVITILFVIMFVCLSIYFLFFAEQPTEEQLLNKYPTDQDLKNKKKMDDIENKRRNEAEEKKEGEKIKEKTKENKKEKCDVCYFVPKGHVHCIKCPIDNCSKCGGHKHEPYCLACKNSFTPFYDNKKRIKKCSIYTCDKGDKEKCLTCKGKKCGSCNKGYTLENGKCELIYSFKGIYLTNNHNENIMLINERYKNIIEKVIIDDHPLAKPTCNYTYPVRGIHTVFMILNTKNLDTVKKMFLNVTGLKLIKFKKDFNTEKILSMKEMFRECRNLESIELSNLNTRHVEDFSYMFEHCSSLEQIDLSSVKTKNAKNISHMFSNCRSLKSLSLKNFDTKKTVDMSGLFSNCSSLTSIDLSHLNTENTEYMQYMFSGCSFLQKIDISSFKTDKVKDISYMFRTCSSLESIDLLKFNSINVINMEGTFMGCQKLSSLDLSNFHTPNLKNANKMFYWCKLLENIDISHLKIIPWNNKDKFFNSYIAKKGKICVRESFLDKIKDNIPSGWEIIKPNKKNN